MRNHPWVSEDATKTLWDRRLGRFEDVVYTLLLANLIYLNVFRGDPTCSALTGLQKGAGLNVPLPECTRTECTIFGSNVPSIGYIGIMVGLLFSVEDPIEG